MGVERTETAEPSQGECLVPGGWLSLLCQHFKRHVVISLGPCFMIFVLFLCPPPSFIEM